MSNKKTVKLVSIGLSLLCLPQPIVTAETATIIGQSLPKPAVSTPTVTEDTPTSNVTVPSMSSDLMQESILESINESTIEEPVPAEIEESVQDQSSEELDDIVPQAEVYLTEGPGEAYDLNEDFANALRATQNGWASKPVGGITQADMERISMVNVSNRGLTSIKGIEYATRVDNIWCSNNNIETIDISNLPNLLQLDCRSNNLTNLTIENLPKLRNLYCNDNQLTELRTENLPGLLSLHCSNNNISRLDLEKSVLLNNLSCSYNQIEFLNVNNCVELTALSCSTNKLTELNLSNLEKIQTISAGSNLLEEINVTKNRELDFLNISFNNITTVDISQNLALVDLYVTNNNLSGLDVTKNIALERLWCATNPLIKNLDVTQNSVLNNLTCSNTGLKNIDVTKNPKLDYFDCSNNEIEILDVRENPELTVLYCDSNKLSELDVTQNLNLINLRCQANQELEQLDVTKNSKLSELIIGNNRNKSRFKSIDTTKNPDLKTLDIQNCEFSELPDLSQNSNLEKLLAMKNYIKDISSLYGFNKLAWFNVNQQTLEAPVPPIIDGKATVKVTKTYSGKGLSKGFNIPYELIVTPLDDDTFIIEKRDGTNLTQEELIELKRPDKRPLDFSYTASLLSEGMSSYRIKAFAGDITFYPTDSKLVDELTPVLKKVKSNGISTWNWNITSDADATASSVKPKLTLPAGLTVVSNSVKLNGVTTSENILKGEESIGDLNLNETKTITFDTKANTFEKGAVGDWLSITGELDWKDSLAARSSETVGKIQIQDDEQTFKPEETKDLAIVSTPIRFNYGMKRIPTTVQSYQLNVLDYQTNTNVINDGFYVRVKDDRINGTGWKLTSALSEFKNLNGGRIPKGDGISLSLGGLNNGMKIESILNRDSENESIDSSPTGVPNSVANQKLIPVGQTAQTLVSANPNEGQGTWQLKIPFDQVKLNLPGGAGLVDNNYQAKLTWSLDDTP